LKKKLLITGASGFIGKNLVNDFLDRNYKVTIVLRKKHKNLFKNKKVKYFFSNNLFKEKINWWRNKLKNIDVIIHLAWEAKPPKYQSSLKNFDCLNGSLNIASAALELKVKKFIGIGTCYEYDIQKNKKLSIKTALNPKTIYAASKASLYLLLKNFFHNSSTTFIWARLFYVFGKGDHKNKLIPYVKRKIKLNKSVFINNPYKVKDYISVNEVCKKIIKISTTNKKTQNIYNICSGKGLTIRKIVEKISNEYNCKYKKITYIKRKTKNFDPDYVVGINNFNL
jgi:nucleoside-diphosphate-sugar epimerase